MRQQAVRYTKGEITKFLVVFYAAAILCAVNIVFGQSAAPPAIATPLMMATTVVGFAVVLPLALWFDVKVRRIRVLFYILMHIVGGSVVVFYLGTYNPIEIMWVILCVISFAEFGFTGFAFSAAALYGFSVLFCTLLSFLFVGNVQIARYTFYSLIFCTAMTLTGYAITNILHGSEKRRRELERMRAAETGQLNKVNAILNSINDAILTLGADGKITSQNAAALAFFDTNESLVGKRVDRVLRLIDESSKPINVKKMVTNVTRNESRNDVMIPNKDTGDMRLSLQMSPIYTDNHRQGIVMAFADITKQKTLEQEKDEFISVASHELRTPIAIAEGSLGNLMIMVDRDIETPKLKSAVSIAHDQMIYLAGVVNDLSTLSRAERGVADQSEPINVDELMHAMYNKYLPEAQKKSLRMELDIKPNLPIVEVSRLYVEEMLQNLITNALKYTKKGSVTLTAEPHKDGVICSVVDTGIGISKSDQKHLGERFFRSEDYRTRESSGTGLGLYVVDKLASKIGTRINVTSRLNHGSTFSVVIPLKPEAKTTGKRSSVTES